jgi:hypothetical protein
MHMSSSWEAACCAATQEISNILWNMKVHYHVRNSQSLAPIMTQMNPVHITPSYVYNIHVIVIHAFRISQLYPICITPLPLIRATFTTQLIILDFVALIILDKDYKLRNSSVCSLYTNSLP